MPGSTSGLNIAHSNIVIIIGPTEHMAVIPKLFSLLLLPPTVPATEAPNASIKGTVRAPVVTPPESKHKAIY